ncbi:MAG TPA: alpha/beta fold hydrolase, partial [Candidatus Thermoplasmatota archaeon]|nr:alpha/beta fold hydrolase [Candidatus Thermoplasmatota archaeon]
MATALVHDLAEALADAGWRAARFDYRGVGRSAGEYGQGEGEAADAAAVADALAEESGRPPTLVGYSFGGAVACRLAATHAVSRLVLVATPLLLPKARLRPAEDARRVSAPAHLVIGDRDPFVPPGEARRLAAAFRPPAGLDVVPGAGHFLDRDHHA